MNLSINEITFSKHGLAGYAFKIESSGRSKKEKTMTRNSESNGFQLKFEKNYYIGELTDQTNYELQTQRLDITDIQEEERTSVGQSSVNNVKEGNANAQDQEPEYKIQVKLFYNYRKFLNFHYFIYFLFFKKEIWSRYKDHETTSE